MKNIELPFDWDGNYFSVYYFKRKELYNGKYDYEICVNHRIIQFNIHKSYGDTFIINEDFKLIPGCLTDIFYDMGEPCQDVELSCTVDNNFPDFMKYFWTTSEEEAKGVAEYLEKHYPVPEEHKNEK